MNFNLLKELCSVHAPSGNEIAMKEFLIEYIRSNQHDWRVKPLIIEGDGFQDGFLLVFGNPITAVFAHMDSIGFTVRYGHQLVPIGGPEQKSGYKLRGSDSQGEILCELEVSREEEISYKFSRQIERGTELVFDCNFREDQHFVQSCYLDNRLGVFNALKLAETLENGIIAFSCWEEHGGGSVSVLAKYIYENFKVRQALISDITWITEGVRHGQGVVISMRDRSIPRRGYLNKIINLAKTSGIPFQLEVEAFGGSDGKELQASPYPFDWVFIGAAEDNVHSPDEKVHKEDISSMINMYKFLMENL
ncbi:hypothetical protein MYP_1026 [Sporocytophaga myxococcoides]|uniref:Aminopeptidase n=1 Tax=Sporocytophaga myxococcoides TaxID=153721 RepID=A0A098LCM4_9BACT|nr:aminopeptidase [Sporocytophaga myxococcoides]GAL83798.1 hypothetical protein MYP_1026 [Sporocytophaga myxococcoides]